MRSIPDNNLAYPVLIQIGNSVGTGFFSNVNSAVYLVTARHVLFDPNSSQLISDKAILTSYSQDVNDNTPNILEIDLIKLQNKGDLSFHAQADVAIIKILNLGLGKASKFVEGITMIARAKEGILGVHPTTLKKFSEILVANDVYVFGYPVSLGMKNIPQIDYQRPLIRKGIVAGKNENLQTIILDCPVFPGNSGGPVLEVEIEGDNLHFRIIGVVSQFIPVAETWVNQLFSYTNLSISNSGYSVATPIDFVLEIITQLEKTRKP
jgi:S1-C subfamily serine protease